MPKKASTPKDIKLPNWIGDCRLSLDEIGAVTSLVCLTSRGDLKTFTKLLKKPGMADACKSLQRRKILSIDISEKELVIQLDLDKVKPKK